MKVSLIATVLNEAATITALFDSILAQTRPPDEVVVVDGGSADETVPSACAKIIVSAYPGTAAQLIVEGANHTFHCANPLDRPSPALNQVLATASSFFAKHLR